MRGERLHPLPAARGHTGSSPHARGTLLPFRHTFSLNRFIPACAGNAGDGSGSVRVWSVHPRMRGERPGRHAAPFAGRGSSPHARGTPEPEHLADLRVRFIPACAGNAPPRLIRGRGCPVHPRMRGERHGSGGGAVRFGGSSPHARGTRGWGGRHVPRGRFIPACAGNASMRATTRSPRPVHPRMRGERFGLGAHNLDVHGSSPHARGTPLALSWAVVGAWAVAVHPRMRGERRLTRSVRLGARGSSPHARGTRQQTRRREHVPRFIPACAGNARGPGRHHRPRPVHPRMRGERQCAAQCVALPFGSSPHARGTPQHAGHRGRWHRFIPACAGNA